MQDDVMQYTKTSLICQQDKVEKVKVVGLLEPLPVPTRPWDSVSMDFIRHLSKVCDLKAILVIIDWFLKSPVSPHYQTMFCRADYKVVL